MPKLASAFATDNYKEVNQNLKYSLSFIVVIGLPCLAGIDIIAGPIILTVAEDMVLLLLFRNEFFMGFAEPVIQKMKHERKQSK